MKLKTSLLFWQNQFCKIVILITLGSFSARSFSQEQILDQRNPGLIESLERLIEVHKKQFEQSTTKAQSNLISLSNLPDLKTIKFDPQFMRSLLFYSDENFLKLAQKDECKLLSMLENKLLKTASGEVNNIQINFLNKEKKVEVASIPSENFFPEIYKVKCLNNREFSTLFNDSNFSKTIEAMKFTIPKNTTDCDGIHKEWTDNSFTPYLCHIQQVIKKNKEPKTVSFYKSRISTLNLNYMDNLCNNLNSSGRFCENYLKSDIWSRILNGEAPLYKMSYKCQNLFNKPDELTTQDLKNCASKLQNTSELCESKCSKYFPSLFPLQNCDNTSLALSKAKLITNYHDCPGNVDNEAITNIHRIVNHFAPRKIIPGHENCAGEASYTFARLNLDIKHDEGWPLKICFLNHVSGKEECLPYIPGSKKEEPLSEDQVIASVLYHHKGAASKTQCRIVDSKVFNPLRSEFKFGCFIVYNAESCTTLFCEKKVIWEEKVLTDIKYIGSPLFDYLPSTFINERYSFSSLLNEVKGTQSRLIKNLTDLKFYLDKIPTSIIHGVGCAEDLLPEDFQRVVINQCRPMPFIIDGHVQKNFETWIVLRSAIDDLHTPRLVSWQNIFNAVSAYRELHPLNSWTLYGIKK